MPTVLKAERGKLQEEYTRLRARIFDYYHLLALIGGAPGARERKLPPKLGYWTSRHSELVRAVDERIHPTVQHIEKLLTQRDPARIKAQHTWLRRGDNFRRKGKGKMKAQINPGEWPPRYK
jgi:hypothetical protein